MERGFGKRGISGTIESVRYSREKNLPFLGICLGMQMAVIEFSSNILGLKEADSTEMNPETPHPVIDLMEDQKSISNKGGTMRLGAWKCDLKENSIVGGVYQYKTIDERHRHRYEFNDKYKNQLEDAGLIATGINPQTGLVEIIEIPAHPWFVGVQYHPEYKSTVANPHPLFVSSVKAAHDHSELYNEKVRENNATI